MPQFTYRARDKEGNLRTGQRFAFDIDNLNSQLIKEGIYPFNIKTISTNRSYFNKIHDFIQGRAKLLEELSIFARQMQLLHSAGVPMVTALKQLAAHSRSYQLTSALNGIIEYIEKGQSLATAMQYYPEVFSPLAVNLIKIGESTGRLSESFEYLHNYLNFEATSTKQIKSAFRYPIFVLVSIIFAIIVMNIFVIPTFAKFYVGLDVSLPWQTRFLIGMSNFFVQYGLYVLIVSILAGIYFYRYLHTPHGKYQWHRLLLRLPLFGKLMQRLILVRFTQSLAIILNAGVPATQGLNLVKNIITNVYVTDQINIMQELIERGVPFTQALTKIDLFTPLEIQILAVGEKNGELSPALTYISNFHRQEIDYEIKRINDFIGPVMISAISGLILIIALGVYLPIWNMINLVHS